MEEKLQAMNAYVKKDILKTLRQELMLVERGGGRVYGSPSIPKLDSSQFNESIGGIGCDGVIKDNMISMLWKETEGIKQSINLF